MMQITRGLKAALQTPRWRWALLVAVVSDSIGFGLGLIPPIQWVVDAVTVLVLLRVLGFSWPLMVALAVEAIPFLEVFPTWTLVVLVMAGTDKHSRQPSSR
jgi:hypothetical protein